MSFELTDEQVRIVVAWADATGVGFEYGPETPDVQNDPAVVLYHRLKKATGEAE